MQSDNFGMMDVSVSITFLLMRFVRLQLLQMG